VRLEATVPADPVADEPERGSETTGETASGEVAAALPESERLIVGDGVPGDAVASLPAIAVVGEREPAVAVAAVPVMPRLRLATVLPVEPED
jgi:hypothetical protein